MQIKNKKTPFTYSRKTRLSLFLLIMGTLAYAVPLSAAPSFNCSGKLSKNERLICKNRSLSQIDQNIADTYNELTSFLNRSAADLIRGDQKRFVKQRQQCGSSFRCTQALMQGRLDELTADLNEQKKFRNSERGDFNDEQANDDICGPGFILRAGNCVRKQVLELENSTRHQKLIPSGRYWIYVFAHGAGLYLDATADKLLFTQTRLRDHSAEKQSFFVIFQNGSYTVTEPSSGKRLHADGGGDKKVSVRFQPRDDFTKFSLSPANEGCFYVQTVATGNYWTWEPNSQVIKVAKNPKGEESMFCFEKI